VGAGVLVGATGGGAVIDALSGHVAGGIISHHDLREVGESLNTGDAGLIVVAAVDVQKRIDEVLKRADKIIQKEITSDRQELEAEIKEAEMEGA